jgi:hypothetical protein
VSPTWDAFYHGDLQGLWSLIVLPALFLLVRPWRRPRRPGADPRAARFVCVWATVFALETIADPPAIVLLGLPVLPFVLLGDFRVFLLVLGVVDPDRPLAGTIARAAAWTMVVPVIAWSAYRLATVLAGPIPEQGLWLVYEIAFVALALWWRERRVPARRPIALRYLRAVLAYVAVYYALWGVADVLILAGFDAGWALRVIPNQLYYSFWVPVAWGLFFSRRYASARSPVQARR